MKVPEVSNQIIYMYKGKMVAGVYGNRHPYKVSTDEETGRLVVHLKKRTYWVEFICILFILMFSVWSFMGYYFSSTVMYDNMVLIDKAGNSIYTNIVNKSSLPIDYDVNLYEGNQKTTTSTLLQNDSIPTMPILNKLNEYKLEFVPRIFMGLVKKTVTIRASEIGEISDN